MVIDLLAGLNQLICGCKQQRLHLLEGEVTVGCCVAELSQLQIDESGNSDSKK